VHRADECALAAADHPKAQPSRRHQARPSMRRWASCFMPSPFSLLTL
jgi:hypothetical protein